MYLASTSLTGTIKSAVHAILSGDDDVTAIVGTRISPGGDPARGVPAVTFYQISGVRDHTMDGPDDWVTPTMQVNSYARTDDEATILADTVADALNGYSGTVDGCQYHISR